MHKPIRRLLLAMAIATIVPVKGHAAGAWIQQGWWKLNETGGTSLKDSVNGNTGTAHGPTVDTGCNGGSNCRHFDGINDYLLLPRSTKTQPGAKNFSVVLTIWASFPKPPAGDDLFRSSGYPKPFWKVEINDPPTDGSQPNLGRINCSFRGTKGQSYIAGGPDLYDGIGHTVECLLLHGVGAGGTDRTELWTDGVRRVYLDAPVGTIQTGLPTIVGKHATQAAGFFSGWIDDLRIYTQTP